MKTQISALLFFIGIFCMAQNTFVPDDHFEQELINLGYDSGPVDDYVPTANINTVTSLDLSYKNVSDLTGLQAFTALLFLGVDGNQITTLNVSNNTALAEISASDNTLLTALNTANLVGLHIVHANRCQIHTVDFSTNLHLMDLELNNNQLTLLNINNNADLEALFVANNLLTALNVSQNPNLWWLNCKNNQITSLDLSQNPRIKRFEASDNQLGCLNVQNGNNYPYWMTDPAVEPIFNTLNNPNLTCIQVDDVAQSQIYWTQKDSWTSFSLNCGPCLLGSSEVPEKQTFIYPNPAKDRIYFKNYREISELKIYDPSGKLIKTEKPKTESVDISPLKPGIYLMTVKIAGKIISHKIIKH